MEVLGCFSRGRPIALLLHCPAVTSGYKLDWSIPGASQVFRSSISTRCSSIKSFSPFWSPTEGPQKHRNPASQWTLFVSRYFIGLLGSVSRTLRNTLARAKYSDVPSTPYFVSLEHSPLTLISEDAPLISDTGAAEEASGAAAVAVPALAVAAAGNAGFSVVSSDASQGWGFWRHWEVNGR